MFRRLSVLLVIVILRKKNMSKKEVENTNKTTEAELIGYFRSELKADDTRRVEKWIASSKENKTLAEDVYKIVLGRDILDTVTNISAEEALKKVKHKIRSGRTKLFIRRSQQIAAILFIPLLLSFAYLLLKDINKEPDYITFKTNPGIVADFVLPDGSKVWLNAHSELSYLSTFKGDKREVKLSGEAYFQVEQDKKHPFIVGVSDDVRIEVTGTEFNVDAYERNQQITAMLVSGGINMSYPNKIKGEHKTILKPGQKIIFEKETGEVTMLYASALVETGWKDGKIYLKNTPLEHLLHTLSKRFNVDFVLKNELLKENYFTGIFGTQDLNLILKHLEVSSGIKHKIKMPENNDSEERIMITLY